MKYRRTLLTFDMDFRNPSEMTGKELKKEISKCLCIMYLEGKIDMTDTITSSIHYDIDENWLLSMREEKLNWYYV